MSWKDNLGRSDKEFLFESKSVTNCTTSCMLSSCLCLHVITSCVLSYIIVPHHHVYVTCLCDWSAVEDL